MTGTGRHDAYTKLMSPLTDRPGFESVELHSERQSYSPSNFRP